MLQTFLILLAQVNAGKTSEDLLNSTTQIIYSLYWQKEVTKEVCHNLINSIKLQNRMDAKNIFMNSKNNKTSDSHRILLKLAYKINLKRSDRYVVLSNFSIYYTWKNMKKVIQS